MWEESIILAPKEVRRGWAGCLCLLCCCFFGLLLNGAGLLLLCCCFARIPACLQAAALPAPVDAPTGPANQQTAPLPPLVSTPRRCASPSCRPPSPTRASLPTGWPRRTGAPATLCTRVGAWALCSWLAVRCRCVGVAVWACAVLRSWLGGQAAGWGNGWRPGQAAPSTKPWLSRRRPATAAAAPGHPAALLPSCLRPPHPFHGLLLLPPPPLPADYRPTPLEHYVFPAGGDGLFLAVDSKGTFRRACSVPCRHQRCAGRPGGAHARAWLLAGPWTLRPAAPSS